MAVGAGLELPPRPPVDKAAIAVEHLTLELGERVAYYIVPENAHEAAVASLLAYRFNRERRQAIGGAA